MSELQDWLSAAELARRSQQRVDDLSSSSSLGKKRGEARPEMDVERLLREPGTALAWVKHRMNFGWAFPQSAAFEPSGGMYTPAPAERMEEYSQNQLPRGEAAAAEIREQRRPEMAVPATPAGDDEHHPRVMISYTHDSPAHIAEALALADRLRSQGVDCVIDRYEESPAQGWPRWMLDQIDDAEWVLVVCTETYNKRVRGHEVPGKGLGASWEGAVIMQEIYEEQGKTTKFVPVVFDPQDAAHRPTFLRSLTYYALRDAEGYERLYRRLTNQPKIVKPELGPLQAMPPAEPRTHFRSIDRDTPP
jgi:hypothetical protein